MQNIKKIKDYENSFPTKYGLDADGSCIILLMSSLNLTAWFRRSGTLQTANKEMDLLTISLKNRCQSISTPTAVANY